MPTFLHDSISFHFEDSGSGLPFVFQHGLGADVTQPFGLFKPPRAVRLIAMDVRAHGVTSPVGDPAKLCFRTFGEDLLALFEHLQLDRAVVGGISMGAALALHFTLRWPKKVVGLVLSRPAWLESPCPWNVKMFSLVSDLIQQHGPTEALARFLQTPEYREALERWPDVASSLANQFRHPRAQETATKLERIIQDTPHLDRDAWQRLALPGLVLGNRLDPVHPFEYAEDLARTIPGAQLREVTSKSISLERHNADVQVALDEFFAAHFPESATC